MKRLIFFLPLLAVNLYADVFTFPQPKGLNTDDAEIFLQDGQASEEQNTVTDQEIGLTSRLGFTKFSTEPCKELFEFAHSTSGRYFICQSSNNIKATKGAGNFSIFVGTTNVDVRTVFSQYGDRLYWANTTDGLKYWDTSAVTTSTGGLKVSQLATFNSRLYASGKAVDPRTIYVSEFGNPDNFALAANPTEASPARIQVQGSLDEALTGLYATFKGKLIWFKGHAFGRVDGIRRSQFSGTAYSDTIGTSYPETIRECDGALRWLGPNKKVYEFDGAQVKPITNDIDTFMDSIVQGDANSRSWTQTTSDDWGNGLFIGTNISTSSSDGEVIFSSISTVNDTFDDQILENDLQWNVVSGSWSASGRNLHSEAGQGGYINTPNNVIVGTWTITPSSISAWTNNYFYFASQNGDGTGDYYRLLFQSIPEGFRLNFDRSASGSTGLIVSTVIAANLYGNQPLLVSRSETGEFTLNVGSTSITRLSTGTYSTVITSNFFVIFSQSGDVGVSSITQTGPAGDVLNSSFTSQRFNIGSAITSWGTFQANHVLNNGNIIYSIYSDSDTTFSRFDNTTYIDSQTITSGQIPTIDTGAYVIVSSSFTRSLSTNTPTLNDFTVNWNEGSTAKSASIYLNQRYQVAVAVSSTSNNRVMVLDRKRDWHRYVGKPVDAMSFFSGSPYFSNSGGVFEDESGYTDNGQAIVSIFKTKGYAPTNLNYRKTLDELYMTTTNNDNTLQTQYYVDGYNNAYSMANYTMNTEVGFQDFKLPFPAAQVKQGKFVSIKWTISGTSKWVLLNTNLYYTSDTIPSE